MSVDGFADRARQLTAIDEDWDCAWPLDWQRHYRMLADLVDADGMLPDIQPGVLFESDDLGRWLERQANSWAQLSQEQRLTRLGIKPAERPSPAPVGKSAVGGLRARRRRPSSGAWRPWRSTSRGKAPMSLGGLTLSRSSSTAKSTGSSSGYL
jgi:hypothetical protein